MLHKSLITSLKALSLIALLIVLLPLSGCGDEEGDITSPLILPSATNAYFTTSSDHTLRVDVETGAWVEVSVGEDLTATEPTIVGSTADADIWEFDVSGLQPGGNSVVAVARDRIGNQRSLLLSVTYDFVSIDRLVTPIDPAITTSLNLAGTVSDTIINPLDIKLEIEPGPFNGIPDVSTLVGNRWEESVLFDDTNDADGVYTLTVTADDGTTSYAVATTFSLAAGVPEVAFAPDPLNGWTCQAGEAYSLELNSGEIESGTCVGTLQPPVVPWTLVPGKNFLKLTVTDSLGVSAVAFDSVWN